MNVFDCPNIVMEMFFNHMLTRALNAIVTRKVCTLLTFTSMAQVRVHYNLLLSISLILSSCTADEFSGGKTRFYSDMKLKPEHCVTPLAGLGLIFRQPPSAHYSHDGELVCNGFKYLIRSDVMYKKVK